VCVSCFFYEMICISWEKQDTTLRKQMNTVQYKLSILTPCQDLWIYFNLTNLLNKSCILSFILYFK